MKIKKLIGRIHLWLGAISGLLVIIISITGCLYAFEKEIRNLIEDYRFVEVKDKPFLLPSELTSIAQAELPGKHIHAVQYNKANEAAEVIFYNSNPRYYYKVYLDPYNGSVQKIKNFDRDFFRIVLMGHFYLWLPPKIGQPLVASATLVFIAMLISGIILWWPKNKSARKQRFSIKWSGRWRRKNYDLHNVLGFYSSFIVLVLALTGLVWGFQWFANSLHWLAGGEKSLKYKEPVSVIPQDKSKLSSVSPVDQIWLKLQKEHPDASSIEVHIPDTDSSVIATNSNVDDATYWQRDFRFFDQYTLEEKSVNHIYGRIDNASAGDKLIRMNYDIHTGAIIGLPGKILAFFASLIFASLPVTGFYIWWGRRKKEKSSGQSGASDSGLSAKGPSLSRGGLKIGKPIKDSELVAEGL